MKNKYVRRDNCLAAMNELKANPTLIVFDTETTGLLKTSEIIQLSAIKLVPPANGDWSKAKVTYLNQFITPRSPVPSSKELQERAIKLASGEITSKTAFDVNHISSEMLAAAPDEDNAVKIILDFFSGANAFVGYNVKFDISHMQEMFKRTIGTEVEFPNVIDVMKIAEEIVNRKEIADGHFSQSSIAQLYGIDLGQLHSSDADTLVCAKLLFTLLQDYAKNYTADQDPAIENNKCALTIAKMKNQKYSKTSNFVMINVFATVNGQKVIGAFHYNRYDKDYTEDAPGYLMPICNMLQFTKDADEYAGGKITSFKD